MDYFKNSNDGVFGMGIESIGFAVVCCVFLNVLWEINKW